MNKRKLQLSYDKCARMHIRGRREKEAECENVVIDHWEVEKVRNGSTIEQKDVHKGEVSIKTVSEYLYLGDCVRSDGSNKDNIKIRVNKGRGILRDIIQILEEIQLGPYFFDALKQLRNSMLISVITYNLEVSPNMTKKDIKSLEDLDLSLVRKALNLSAKSSHHLIYLETGFMSVEWIIKKKRLMYYHHLLNSDDSSINKQVPLAQIEKNN